ncbi:MAG: hypothetical protein RLZZ59_493 [Pseudomonadota bacterium]|jgi:putative permease
MIAKISIYSLLIGAVLFFLLISIPSILYPFIIAFILSYLLNPSMSFLDKKYGLSSSVTAFLVTISMAVTIISAFIYFGPIIYEQMETLIHRMPYYKEYVVKDIIPVIVAKLIKIDPSIANKAKAIIDQSVNIIFGIFLSAVHNFWGYTLATMHLIFFIILTPVLLFFFLRDWSSMSKEFFGLFPKNHQAFVKTLFKDIDRVLGAYIRGLMIVCTILATYYTVSFKLVSLEFAALLGVLSGVAIAIPLIGGVMSISISVLVVHFTYGFDMHIIYLLSIYACGAILENVFLTPKIIGDSIGLSPLWIIFSVLMFGYISGPVGMVLAIPITAVMKVILLHIKSDYKNSSIYNAKA